MCALNDGLARESCVVTGFCGRSGWQDLNNGLVPLTREAAERWVVGSALWAQLESWSAETTERNVAFISSVTQRKSGPQEPAPEFPVWQDFKEEESLLLQVSLSDVEMRLLPAGFCPGELGWLYGPFPGLSGGAKG